MDEREWHYMENSEEIATRGNFKKMLKITNYQTSGINTQVLLHPEIIPWKARRDPFALDFVTKYGIWNGSGGTHEGQTLNLGQRFSLATKQLNTIDIGIQNIVGENYIKGTVNYLALFPNGHYDFTTGAIETRIAEWTAFANRMGTDVNLAAFKTSALAIGASLDGIRTGQTGAIGSTKVFSGDLETSRVALAKIDYKNLGQYMDAYVDNHPLILALCDTETIRESLQSKFTGTLAPSENEGVLKHGFLITDTFTAQNTTPAPQALYLASTVHGTDSTVINVPANSKITVTISMFGAIDLNTHRFLTIINLSGAIASHFIIQL